MGLAIIVPTIDLKYQKRWKNTAKEGGLQGKMLEGMSLLLKLKRGGQKQTPEETSRGLVRGKNFLLQMTGKE